jgi:zinc transport system substrate-binding protein
MAAACTTAPRESNRLSITATITPLASIVREIAGERAHVTCLLPPGASPHTFEPRPGDLARLSQAALLVRVGAGLDEWSERLLSDRSRRLTTVTFVELDGAEPLPWPTSHAHDHGHTSLDPHIWLDPIRVRDALVPALLAALVQIDPEGRDHYERRAADVASRLTELDRSLRTELSALESRAFIAYHDTWRYFAARYDLNVAGSIEAYAGDEPTAAELAALIADARRTGARAVMLEPQLGERIARSVASEIGARVQLADPLGDPTDPARADYFANMKFNAAAFALALGSDER